MASEYYVAHVPQDPLIVRYTKVLPMEVTAPKCFEKGHCYKQAT